MSSFTNPQPETRLGPALPEEIRPIGSFILPNALTDRAAGQRLRLLGWASGGYTWSSQGEGLLAVEPCTNRFGDQWLLNQAVRVLERTLAPEK